MDGDAAPAGRRELLEEACRLVDRLDRLDAMLVDREAWMTFSVDESGTEVTVYVDKVLSEARQQQIALKQVLAELRQRAAVGGGSRAERQAAAAGVTAGGGGAGTGVTDLTARIAARRSTPAG